MNVRCYWCIFLDHPIAVNTHKRDRIFFIFFSHPLIVPTDTNFNRMDALKQIECESCSLRMLHHLNYIFEKRERL